VHMFLTLKRKLEYLFEIFDLLPAGDRRKILFLGILQFVISLFDLIGILLIGVVTSLGLSAISSTPIPAAFDFVLRLPVLGSLPLEKTIIWLSLISAVLLMGKTLASALIMKKIVGFLALREAIISTEYIRNISNNSPRWQLQKSPQYISGVAIEGANSAITVTLGQLVSLIVESLSLLLIFIGISSFDITITGPSFAFFIATGWLSLKYLSHRTRSAGKEEFFLGISSRDLIRNIVVGSRELYLSNRQSELNSRYSGQRLKNYQAIRTKAMAALIPKYVSEITMISGGLLIATYQFAIKDARGAITGLVIFAGLSSRVLPSLLRLQGAVLQIRGSSEASKNFLSEFKEASIIPSAGEKSTFMGQKSLERQPIFTPTVTLSGATVRHSQNSDFMIKGVTLEIQAGEFFAIAGPSGSGKTTLADLMLGIIEPSSGEVKISGFNPSDAVQKWPGQIRYVPQDVNLIPGTILENVMWPDFQSSLNETELQKLFALVELTDWIESLEYGWDTQINGLGNNLSGGQKQRLGIARALYSSPSILFLDESTSSLDVQTEQEIVQNILTNMRDVTRIVIAHRISTIRGADRIAYLENGIITAIGNYSELTRVFSEFDIDETN
jgi:ABC-type bacteriocin/lantibiotic exporter with double-glycine peptidase domain